MPGLSRLTANGMNEGHDFVLSDCKITRVLRVWKACGGRSKWSGTARQVPKEDAGPPQCERLHPSGSLGVLQGSPCRSGPTEAPGRRAELRIFRQWKP